ncbi:MAG: methionine--tRNA ligase [Oricola sp.]
MSAKERFYITTPIFYPNGVPHIGHAYTAIATDVLARFARHDGKDVFFLTGTDEHGQKMQRTAEQEGIAPIELADRNSAVFRRMVEALGCSNDDFIRTTEERHKKSVQELWRRMEANGDIYLGKYGGWYSVRQEAYFDESETTLGDDGVRREPLGSPVEWVEEESYYFRLSAYGDKLLELYEKNPDFVLPAERRNEVASFVKSGLKDLSISRTTFDWGVPVPGDDRHVMYVWVDALTNYITAAGFPDETAERWRYWPAMHIIGKDIVRFHAVYWPAFLMSAGVELPKRVYAHGFLFNKGEKMSKSVGNVVDPFALIDAYGLDQVRYFFMREVPFGNDGSYSHEAIVNRINADLANGLGNLAQRSLSMIAKHCDGRVPEHGDFTPEDEALLATAAPALAAAREAMDRQAIHKAIEATFEIAAEADRYIDAQAPWALRKTDPDRMKTVLYVVAETVRRIAILAQPYIPGSAEKLLDLVAAPAGERDFDSLERMLVPGTELPAPTGVFPRYVDKEAEG